MKEHGVRIVQGIVIVTLFFAIGFVVGDGGRKLIEAFVTDFIKTALG